MAPMLSKAAHSAVQPGVGVLKDSRLPGWFGLVLFHQGPDGDSHGAGLQATGGGVLAVGFVEADKFAGGATLGAVHGFTEAGKVRHPGRALDMDVRQLGQGRGEEVKESAHNAGRILLKGAFDLAFLAIGGDGGQLNMDDAIR